MENLQQYKVHRAPASVYYIPDYLTIDEEIELYHSLYSTPKNKWTVLKNRRLQNVGGIPTIKGMVSEKLPMWLEKCTDKVSRLGVFAGESANHVLVSEYTSGQGIMPHVDGPTFYPTICTVNLGCHTVLDLYASTPNDTPVKDRFIGSLLLERRSLLVLQEEAYKSTLHGIMETPTDILNPDRVLNWSQTRCFRGVSLEIPISAVPQVDGEINVSSPSDIKDRVSESGSTDNTSSPINIQTDLRSQLIRKYFKIQSPDSPETKENGTSHIKDDSLVDLCFSEENLGEILNEKELANFEEEITLARKNIESSQKSACDLELSGKESTNVDSETPSEDQLTSRLPDLNCNGLKKGDELPDSKENKCLLNSIDERLSVPIPNMPSSGGSSYDLVKLGNSRCVLLQRATRISLTIRHVPKAIKENLIFGNRGGFRSGRK